jgi:predicted site-specific integrase-resolvase
MFNSILDFAIKGDIKEIVVTRKDRLCRFGFDIVEKIIKDYSNGKIVVLIKY